MGGLHIKPYKIKQIKSTLNLLDCSVGRVHWYWGSTDHNTRDVHRALVRVKIATGVYILQCNRLNLNNMQSVRSAVFVKEDRVHFALECSRLGPVKQKYLMK